MLAKMRSNYYITIFITIRNGQVPSKLNTTDDVPTTPATDSPEVPAMPAPRTPVHDTDVVDVQLLVKHSPSAITTVAVMFDEEKLLP